jgi:two-component system, NarL family, nitrate/nitrite response regulator NarL
MAAIGAHASQDRVVARPLVVLVACRIRLYRDAIVRLLGKQSGISAFWASTIEDGLLTDYDATLPDVVLLDGGMSGGLAMARHLVQARSKARILAFGVDNVAVDVIACAEAGLMGYVPCQASIRELADAVRRVTAGELVCPAAIADKLFSHFRSASVDTQEEKVKAVLTGRQMEILQLIRQGMSNKQIAVRLSLGTSTVKNHVHDLLERLQVGRRGDAAAKLRLIHPVIRSTTYGTSDGVPMTGR